MVKLVKGNAYGNQRTIKMNKTDGVSADAMQGEKVWNLARHQFQIIVVLYFDILAAEGRFREIW
jgi:hypothetical protein